MAGDRLDSYGTISEEITGVGGCQERISTSLENYLWNYEL